MNLGELDDPLTEYGEISRKDWFASLKPPNMSGWSGKVVRVVINDGFDLWGRESDQKSESESDSRWGSW